MFNICIPYCSTKKRPKLVSDVCTRCAILLEKWVGKLDPLSVCRRIYHLFQSKVHVTIFWITQERNELETGAGLPNPNFRNQEFFVKKQKLIRRFSPKNQERNQETFCRNQKENRTVSRTFFAEKQGFHSHKCL